MKLAPRTLIRTAVPAAAAGIVLTAFALPAAAQTPGATVTRSGSTVQVAARPGFVNHIHVGGLTQADGVHLIVEDDLSGVAAFNGCRQVSPTVADCGVGVTQLSISLGDMNDTLFVDQTADQNNPQSAPLLVNASVDAGTGSDLISTGRGNDQINVRDGIPGNDRVTCDGGTQDRVVADPGDSIDPSCELRATF